VCACVSLCVSTRHLQAQGGGSMHSSCCARRCRRQSAPCGSEREREGARARERETRGNVCERDEESEGESSVYTHVHTIAGSMHSKGAALGIIAVHQHRVCVCV